MRILVKILVCAAFSIVPLCRSFCGDDKGLVREAARDCNIIPGSHLLPSPSPDVPRSAADVRSTGWGFSVGSTHSWYAWDFGQDAAYRVPSTCRAVGNRCYIFTEDAGWASGKITQPGVDSILMAMDEKVRPSVPEGIFASVVGTFGDPSDVDSDPRIVILLLDIRDSSLSGFQSVTGYFDPNNLLPVSTQPSSNEAEILYVDIDPLDLSTSSGLEKGVRVLAHELQHLIHYVHDDNEVQFINEMCSMSAELLCGFPPRLTDPYTHATNYRLTLWRPVWDPAIGVDYSRAERFGAYLIDQYGAEVFRPLVASQATATDGIDSALVAISAGRIFDELFVDWTIANILGDPDVDPRYGYRRFPGLPRPDAVVHVDPTFPPELRMIRPLSVEYISYVSGSDLRANFYSQGLSVCFMAVEIGPSGTRVLVVPNGQEFYEPDFGSGVITIHFLALNRSPKAIDNYLYESTGQPAVEVAEGDPETPWRARLMQNYPNPFNPETVVSYQLSVVSNVRLVVYDMLGREVAVLVNERMPPGDHEARFQSAGIASGVYAYTLTAGQTAITKRMIVLR